MMPLSLQTLNPTELPGKRRGRGGKGRIKGRGNELKEEEEGE